MKELNEKQLLEVYGAISCMCLPTGNIFVAKDTHNCRDVCCGLAFQSDFCSIGVVNWECDPCNSGSRRSARLDIIAANRELAGVDLPKPDFHSGF